MQISKRRRRRFGIQKLENRHLLAAQISELLVSPLFGDTDTDQMVELRGEANETLAQGTYLVIVTERGLDPGEIHGIFDLSGQQFGSNGYMVLLQQDSPHAPAPGTKVLQSSEPAFGGLPGDLYSDAHSLSDRIDFIIGANAYMLIQSDVAPQLEQTIDADENGLIDPVILETWSILDSISLHPFSGAGDVAFGNIVYATEGFEPREIITANDVPVIFTEGFGYAGRIGESSGSTAADWLASTVVNEGGSGEPERWALADNLFGTPGPYPFAGRDLDHVGGPNFVGGVRGVVRSDSGTPVSGVSILADTNNNGVRDNLTFVVDPDDVVGAGDPTDEDYFLINAYPGVTITKFSLGSFPSSDVTAEFETEFPNTLANRIFATGGIDWFSNNGVLRFDFYRPINSASVVAVAADSSLSTVFARIEAYGASGQLIDSSISSPLTDAQRETIEVSSAQENIAYVLAYADDDHEVDGINGSPFGRFDILTYTQHEPDAISDNDGYYEIQRLFPQRLQPAPVVRQLYNIQPIGDDSIASPHPIEITKHENAVVDFTLVDNNAPILQSAGFDLAENSEPGTVVGQVVGTDANGHTIAYRIDQPSHGFLVDSETGVISVGPEAELDFETNNRYSFTVIGEDSFSATGEATIVVELVDVNEQPIVETTQLVVDELAEPLDIVGAIVAFNRNAGQPLTFGITGGSGAEDLVIDSATGIVKVAADANLDFESASEKHLLVTVSDPINPTNSITVSVSIVITDQNEPPTFHDLDDPASVGVGEQFDFTLPEGLVTDPEGDNWTTASTIDENELPSWLEYDASQMQYSGVPTSEYTGSLNVTLTAYSRETPELASSLTFQILILISEKPLHNLVVPHDVNGDHMVSALDALQIINFIARVGSEQTIVDQTAREGAFYDVTGNNEVSALDALRVINELARQLSEQEPGPPRIELLSGSSDNDRVNRHDRAIDGIYGQSQLF